MSKLKRLRERLKCNQPTRSNRDDKVKMVKACQDGKEKIIHFGDPNLSVKSHIPERKKSYCARSGGLGKLKDKLSSNYWSRKNWKC